jgi:hypothetical protein
MEDAVGGITRKGGITMRKRMMMSLFVAVVLSAGWAVSAHAFACKCEGSLVVNGGGIDWLNKKGDACGASFIGGHKGDVKNNISTPYEYMSPKYYSNVLNGTVDSAYDPDSGWRCVNRNTY